MLLPPLTFQDISMLLAVSAILLLVTTEFAPSASGEKTLILDMKKLRNLALTLGILFLVTIVITMLNIS
jgi:accessory gene regulator protein AgrB